MSVTVKVLDAASEVASYTFNEGQPLVIDSMGSVNYQLIDDKTGFAPQNILTKREGNDLIIFLDDGNEEADIIIKDYYTNSDALVVGEHENGNIYAYVPESALESDAISKLAEEVSAPQALGGQDLATPFFVFYPNGLAGLLSTAAYGAAIAAVLHKGFADDEEPAPIKEQSQVTPNPDGSVTVTVPADAQPGEVVTVEVKKPNGRKATVELVKQEDGSWTSSNPDIVPAIPAGSNTSTIPNDKVKDNSPVTVTDQNGNTDTAIAANPIPNAPTISERDDETGIVIVGLPTENVEPGDQVVVDYTKPNGEPGKTTLTYGEDGQWTSDNPNVEISVDENGNPIAIFPNKEIKDDTEVTAVSKDGETGKEGEPTKGVAGDPVPSAPGIIADPEGNAWVINFPEDAEIGDKVVVRFKDAETGEDIEVVFTKESDDPAPWGTWASSDPRLEFDPETGTVKVPNELVADGSVVEGGSYNASDKANENGNEAAPAKTVDVPPAAPEVLPPNNETGDVSVKLPTENVQIGDTVTIEYTRPDGTKAEAVIERVPVSDENPTGWKVVEPKDNPDGIKLELDENGDPVAVIPGDKVLDGSEVTARSDDASTASGDVVVDLPQDAKPGDVVNIEYQDKDGNTQNVDVVKQEDGTWAVSPDTPNDDVVIGKDELGNDTVTIPGSVIQDGSDVKVTQPDNTEETIAKPEGASDTGTSGNPEPSAPKVIANEDGSVTIELPEDAQPGDVVKVIYTDKEGNTVVTTVVKDTDGTWKDEDPNTTIDGNTLTIPNSAIKDGTDVTAISIDASKANIPTDEDGNYIAPEPEVGVSDEEVEAIKEQGKSDSATTEDVPPSKPTVQVDEAAGVRVIDLPKDAENGDRVVVKYTDPNGNPKIALVEKTPDGWVPVNDAPIIAQLPTDVEEGAKAKVSYTDPNGNPKEATLTFEDGEWKADPENPDVKVETDAAGNPIAKLPIDTVKAGTDVTVEVDGKEPVTISVPESDLQVEEQVVLPLPEDVQDGDTATVKYSDKDGNPQEATLTYQDGKWLPDPNNDIVSVREDENGNPVAVVLPVSEIKPEDGVTLEVTGQDPITYPVNEDTIEEVALLPNDKVKDGTEVIVYSLNAADEIPEDGNIPVGVDTTDPVISPDNPPKGLEIKDPDNETGNVVIVLPNEDVEPGDSVDIEYIKPDGSKGEATLVKTEDGWAEDPNNPDVTLDLDGDGVPDTDENGNPIATIPGDKVKDGTDVTAKSNNGADPEVEGETVTGKAGDETPEAPKVDKVLDEQDPKKNPDVVINLPEKGVEIGDYVEVGYTDKNGDHWIATIELTEDGWVSNDPNVVVSEDGTQATIDGDLLKPDTDVIAVTINNPLNQTPASEDVKPATEQDIEDLKGKGNYDSEKVDGDLEPAQPTVVADEETGVTITMPTENVEAGDKVSVEFTKPGEEEPTTVDYIAQPDGTWKAEDEQAAKDAGLPTEVAEGGDIVLGNDQTKDNSPVSAVSSDENHPAPAAVDGENKVNAPDPAPAQPTVVADEETGVTITMPTENVEPGDKVSVEFTKPGEEEPTTVDYIAQPDGSWKAEDEQAAKDAGLPTEVAEGGDIVLGNDQTKDNSPVSAVSSDENHPAPEAVDGENKVNAPDPAPAQPTVVADEETGVTITVPTENVEPGDKVSVEFTKPGEEEPTTVDYIAQPDGTWKAEDEQAAKDAGLPTEVAEGGDIVLGNDQTKDNSPVSAVSSDENHPAPEAVDGENKVNAPDPAPAQPTVVADEETGVTITMPTENVEPGDKVSVEFTKPGEDTPTTVDYIAQPDGTWKAEDEQAAKDAGLPTEVEEGGDIVLGNDQTKDNSPVSAVSSDENHPAPAAVDGENKVNAPDPAPAQPTIDAKEDGSVEITMPTENVEPGDKVDVEFTKPDGTPAKVTYVAQPDGSWKAEPAEAAKDLNLPETLAKDEKLVLPNDLVDDNTDVTATAYDESTPKDQAQGQTEKSKDPAPAQPTVEAKDNGDVEITMPTENVEPGDKVSVEFTKPGEDEPTTVDYIAQPDGSWKAEPAEAAKELGLPETVQAGGTVTLPDALTKDDSPVSAVATDETNTSPAVTDQNSAQTKEIPVSQPTFAEEADPANPTGDVVINLPTDAEAGDKVDIEFYKPGEDVPTKVTLTKQPDGTWAAEPADSGIILDGDTATLPNEIVKDGSKVTAVAYDDAQEAPTETPVETTAGDPQPEGLAVNIDENGNAIVDLPTTNVEVGDTVNVVIKDSEGNVTDEITFEKTPDGWVVSEDDKDKGITIDGDQATIPNIPNNSSVEGETINGNTGEVAEQDDANNKVQTDKPVVKDIFAIDTSNPADDIPEQLKVAGTAEPNSLVEVVVNGEVIGTATADDQGNFEVIAKPDTTTNPLNVGDEVEVYATAPDKLKSEKADGLEDPATGEIQPLDIPEVVDGEEGHIGDRTAPKAPQLAAGEEMGSVVVTFPTEDILGNPIQEGDVVEVNFTDENGKKQAVLFTKTPDGWQSSNPDLIPGDGSDGLVTTPSVTIKPDQLQDGSTVSAQTRDIVGNESDWVYENAGADEERHESPDPSVNIVSYDTSEQADRDPEYIHIKGSVIYPEGTDDAGEPMAKGDVYVNVPGHKEPFKVVTDDQGNFELIIKESADIVVKPEHADLPTFDLNGELNIAPFDEIEFWTHDEPRGYLPSYIAEDTVNNIPEEGHKVKVDVLPVLDGAEYHIGDKELPEQPTLTPATSDDPSNPDGGMIVGMPTDAVEGDKVVIEFTDENDQPQKVTLTKQDDGSWKSDNSLLVPDVPARVGEVKIDEDNIKDGSEVTAYSEDLAGNRDEDADGNIIKVSASAGSDEADPEKTSIPTYSTIETFDTEGDNKPEAVEIKGQTEPNAAVKVLDKDGNVVGTATADEEGNFTIQIDNSELANPVSVRDNLEMLATAPGKLESDPANVQVPRVVPATAPLIVADETGSAHVIPQGNDTKVTIKFFDEDDQPREIVVSKNNDGEWEISGYHTTVGEDGTVSIDDTMIEFDPTTGSVTLYENALQDVDDQGNPTKVTAIGNNGNKATYDRTTVEEVRAISALEFEDVYGKDTSVAADEDPEELYFTIKTNSATTVDQLNTKVEIISPTGEVIPVENVTFAKDVNGTVGITITEANNPGLDIQVGSIVRVTQTTADRLPNTKSFTVPALEQGEKWHADVTPPEAPVITPDEKGAATITLPTENTHPGDKVVISIVPEGQTEPVEVTLVKTPDGWISDNPALVPSTVGKENPNEVFIPHNHIADNTELAAKSVGTEGKENPAEPKLIGANIADIDPATITGEIINKDTADQAVKVQIKLEDMVDDDPDEHNATSFVIDIPWVDASGNPVSKPMKYIVSPAVTENGLRKFYADYEPEEGETLNVTDTITLQTGKEYSIHGAPAYLDPNGVITVITYNDEGQKEVAYDLANLGYTPYVEPQTKAPTLLGKPDEDAGLVEAGEVKITPDADNDAMQITYPVENGNGATATVLAQKGDDGKWKLYGTGLDATNAKGETLVTIDEDTGVVTLHPDAVEDNQMVTAIGLKDGKAPSDPATVQAGEEPTSLEEYWAILNDLLPYSPTVGQTDGQDVGIWKDRSLRQQVAQDTENFATQGYGRSLALRSLIDQLQADGAFENMDTASQQWGNDNLGRKQFTLTTNDEDNIMRIYNSFGNMSTHHRNHAGTTVINTQDGNDAIVIGRDLGTSGVSFDGDRRYQVNMGEGNDVLVVGATNDWFKVIQRYEYNPVTGKYDIPGIVDVIEYNADLPVGARYLPNLDLYNDVSGTRRTGGHIANANIDMGNGDDAVVVSGVDSVTTAAISQSTINLGEGDNRLIIAPNGKDSAVEGRGAIAENTKITAGSGNDYLQAPLIHNGAKIDLGNGDNTINAYKVGESQIDLGNGSDTVLINHMVGKAVLNTGAGNDIVTITDTFKDTATVNLGEGDDRFNWGFKTAGGGLVDGGAGYDTISLQGYGAGNSSPVGWNANKAVTNIKSADFTNIEEIVMNGNNVLDIRFADIRDSDTYSFKLDNGTTKDAKFIVSANKESDSIVDSNIASNKVDFGQTDWNRDTDLDLSDTSNGRNGSWSDVGDVTIDGKTYDVYRHSSVGNSEEYDVLVQQGITII